MQKPCAGSIPLLKKRAIEPKYNGVLINKGFLPTPPKSPYFATFLYEKEALLLASSVCFCLPGFLVGLLGQPLQGLIAFY